MKDVIFGAQIGMIIIRCSFAIKNEVPADSHERAVSGDILQDCRSVYGINGIYLVEVL